jgi:hypothetical protein
MLLLAEEDVRVVYPYFRSPERGEFLPLLRDRAPRGPVRR